MTARRAFFARLSVFLLPILGAVGFAAFELSRLRELDALDIDRVVDEQANAAGEVLYGPAYSDCTSRLKLLGIIRRKPEVIVMGTSRSMLIGQSYFKVPAQNAGNGAVRADELAPFLEHIPSTVPLKVVVLLLDQFFLNDATDLADQAEWEPLEKRLGSCPSVDELVGDKWVQVLRDVASRKLPMTVAEHDTGFGVRAQLRKNGLRKDGSLRTRDHEDTSFPDVHLRMSFGSRRYQYGESVSARLVAAIARFLDVAKARGIHVVAILPPYAPSILRDMRASGHYHYVDEVPARLHDTFAGAGAELLDFGDVSRLDLADDDFLDGFHASERAYATVLLEAARSSPSLDAVLDKEGLLSVLAAATDRLFLYE